MRLAQLLPAAPLVLAFLLQAMLAAPAGALPQ